MQKYRRARSHLAAYGFGSQHCIDELENRLKKNIAMRDNTPMVAKTNSGNIGVYGVHRSHVVSIRPDKLDEVLQVLGRHRDHS